MLRIEVQHVDGKLVVRCEGALLRGGDMDRLLELRHWEGREPVVIDLRALRRIDAHGVGVLAAIAQVLHDKGCEVILAEVPPRIQKVFKTCGLQQLLAANANGKPGACSSAA